MGKLFGKGILKNLATKLSAIPGPIGKISGIVAKVLPPPKNQQPNQNQQQQNTAGAGSAKSAGGGSGEDSPKWYQAKWVKPVGIGLAILSFVAAVVAIVKRKKKSR